LKNNGKTFSIRKQHKIVLSQNPLENKKSNIHNTIKITETQGYIVYAVS